MELDYMKDIRIDPDALDVEWLRQPELYMAYCEEAASAKSAVNAVQEKLKVLRSKLILEAREEAGAKNSAEAEAYYRTHPDHIALKKEWVQKDHIASLMNSAVFAFNQRKDALENLVRLAGQGYFATPSTPRDLGEEMRGTSTTREALAERKKSRRKRRV